MKILVAEDNQAMRQALKYYLDQWGHEVVFAVDGREAWNRYQQEPFDIVITDWIMPGMTGLDLVRQIRSEGSDRYVYVILLTVKSELESLVEGMEAGADDFLTKPCDPDEFRVRLRAGERIIQLERRLEERNRALEQAYAEIREKNRSMRRDFEATAKIQRSFLPTVMPKVPGFIFSWTSRPCEQLAGDMLNVFMLDQEHVGLYLLDVSGHGVTAALLSVTISRLLSPLPVEPSLLKRQTDRGESIVSPADVATRLNQRFILEPATTDFFTLIYGIINTRTRQLCYVSAGHPGPILLPSKGQPEFLPGGPPAIAMSENATYREHVVELSPGDRLFVYSDGISDVFNHANEFFGVEHLKESIVRTREQSLRKSIHALMEEIQAWSGNAPLADDVTLLAVEVTAT